MHAWFTLYDITGFSSSFGVDGYDFKVGGLAIECLSHHPLFPGKVAGSIVEVAGFLAGRRPLMRTLSTENELLQIHGKKNTY